MTEVLTGVISALVAVILSMVGVIKLWLPRHDRVLHNPIELEHIRELLEGIKAEVEKTSAIAAERHQALLAGLARLEQKVQ